MTSHSTDTASAPPSTLDIHAVIPAGGSGTRLWPLSRAHDPKFLHPLTGTDRSLLQATVDRLTPLVPPERIHVVTGASHAAAVARQLPEVPEQNIFIEPSPRDSCAAIALATEVIGRRAPGAVVASFAADHLISDPDAFRRTVSVAVEGARTGQLMTIGITPTRPETGYGYLECDGTPAPFEVAPVSKFTEKPPRAAAERYLASGRYLWNASMFVWRSDVFGAQLVARRPDVAKPIGEIAAAWDTVSRDAVMGLLWPTVAKVAVDYAVMEPASIDGLVSTVPGDFGWSDIGDFETVAQVLGSTDDGVTIVRTGDNDGAPVVSIDCDGVVVVPHGARVVATLGVQDLIVVDTADAVLVCRRDRAQDIKKITELLRERGAQTYV